MAKRYTDEDIASAILTAGTISKTAEILGLNRSYLSRRANSENVQKLLHRKRSELFEASCTNLVQATQEAINTLLQTMRCPETTAGGKIRCCEIILGNAFKSFELLDVTNEIRELREEFEAIKERGN